MIKTIERNKIEVFSMIGKMQIRRVAEKIEQMMNCTIIDKLRDVIGAEVLRWFSAM